MSPLAEDPFSSDKRVRGGVLEQDREDRRSATDGLRLSVAAPALSWDRCVLDEESFHRAIALERRRTERSRKPFLLMLLDIGDLAEGDEQEISSEILGLLSLATRETDVIGWYEGSVVGVMFTEITLEDRGTILQVMMDRVCDGLRDNLKPEQLQMSGLPCICFPTSGNRNCRILPATPSCIPIWRGVTGPRKSIAPSSGSWM